jgi:hypothetical protein
MGRLGETLIEDVLINQSRIELGGLGGRRRGRVQGLIIDAGIELGMFSSIGKGRMGFCTGLPYCLGNFMG